MRELTQADVVELGPGGPARPPLNGRVAKIRDSHHRVAMLLASGMRAGEVAKESGYSFNRVALLQGDPSFQELVAAYRVDVVENFKAGIDEYAQLATANMLKAERQIADKLDLADSNEELLPTRDLIAISRDAADRFGYGKRTTQTNLNMDFAAMLDRAIKRSADAKVIEGEVLGAAVQAEPGREE